MLRRGIMLLPGWINRNRPSWVVTGFMTFFIICYVIIVKLDATDRVSTNDDDTTQGQAAKVIRTNENIIPPKVMKEFAQDKKVTKANYDYYNDIVNTTQKTREITTGIFIESDNERMMKEHLEDNENVIEDNWKSYLAKNRSAIKELDSKLTPNIKEDSKNKNVLPISNHRYKADQLRDRLRLLPKYVKIFDPFKETLKQRNSISSNQCLLLKTMHGNAPICIHDPELDEVISGHIIKTGTWEPNYLYTVGTVLKMNQEIEFLDLGCNIGVYTILAAQLGHKGIAVDPNRANLRLLTKSLSLGGFRDKITLLWNAVSDLRENVTLTDIIGNIGATFVETGTLENVDNEHKAFSILLDDLIPLFTGKTVFIKMDVEMYELRTLLGGENFFKEVGVEYVLMEWLYHRQHDTGKDIIDFMTKYGLYPHVNAHHNTKLEPENYQSWPGNVLWIKYEQ
ncbi:uncharacterized protein LOC132744543 [Ruditapes philippinarum]|uniref:uncharacterized protein LOC132744543 n=1 Tax=Ruditapes philippinarum TaxID=129788 RepID=UPI00295B3DF7|nr:uncharacterized protein LOC132744543 [Ruditapes philippinarum]